VKVSQNSLLMLLSPLTATKRSQLSVLLRHMLIAREPPRDMCSGQDRFDPHFINIIELTFF